MKQRKTPSVLIVDDEQPYLTLLESALVEAGYQVEVARNGVEAVEKAQAGRIDVVVMDILMPAGIDGIEAMTQIRSTNPNMPIILNTGYPEYKDNFLTWEADAYVLKYRDPNFSNLKDKIKESLLKLSEKTGEPYLLPA